MIGRVPPPTDLRRLRAFVVLAEELDARAAAARLHVTPPVVSRAVKKLQDELQVALFVRSRGRLQLTDAGERLLPAARALLGAADRLFADLHRVAGRRTIERPPADELSKRRAERHGAISNGSPRRRPVPGPF